MCVYRRLRLAQQMKKTKLDVVLHNELGIGKLTFGNDSEVDTGYVVDGLEWHILMREKYKHHYLCYSIWDVAGMLALDAKTKDLSMSFPIYMGITDYKHARSNPSKILDGMHFYTLRHNYVMGVASPNKDTFQTLGMRNWIGLLSADNIRGHNLGYIAEDSYLDTKIRVIVADTDCTAAYPSAGIAANVSKSTTISEIAYLPKGMDDTVYRTNTMNLLSGPVNDIQFCVDMYNFPPPDRLF